MAGLPKPSLPMNPDGRSLQTAPRLPKPVAEGSENWLYALLTGACFVLLGYEAWTLCQSSGNWHQFVEYVRCVLL